MFLIQQLADTQIPTPPNRTKIEPRKTKPKTNEPIKVEVVLNNERPESNSKDLFFDSPTISSEETITSQNDHVNNVIPPNSEVCEKPIHDDTDTKKKNANLPKKIAIDLKNYLVSTDFSSFPLFNKSFRRKSSDKLGKKSESVDEKIVTKFEHKIEPKILPKNIIKYEPKISQKTIQSNSTSEWSSQQSTANNLTDNFVSLGSTSFQSTETIKRITSLPESSRTSVKPSDNNYASFERPTRYPNTSIKKLESLGTLNNDLIDILNFKNEESRNSDSFHTDISNIDEFRVAQSIVPMNPYKPKPKIDLTNWRI